MLIIILFIFVSQPLCSSGNDGKTPSPTNSPTKFNWETFIDWPSSDDVGLSQPIKRIKSSNLKQSSHKAYNINVDADTEQDKKRKKRLREVYYRRRNDPKKWRRILDQHNKAKLSRKMIEKEKFSKMTKEEQEAILAEKKEKNKKRYIYEKQQRLDKGKHLYKTSIPARELSPESLRKRRASNPESSRKRRKALKEKENNPAPKV